MIPPHAGQLVNQYVLGAEREQLLAAEREQRLLAETLSEVTLALTSSIGRGSVLDEILCQAQRIVPYSTATIALLEDDGLRTVRWRSSEEFGAEESRSGLVWSLTDLPLDDQVVHARQPVIIPDVSQEQRWMALEGTEWVQSYLAVPICLGDRVLGVLRLNGATPHQFSSRDVRWLQPLASAAAIGIENARMVEGLEEEVAAGLDLALQVDETAAAWIAERESRLNRRYGEQTHRQARLPQGFQPIFNPHGTAPAFWLPVDNGRGFCLVLPGVPGEYRAIGESVFPVSDEVRHASYWLLTGLGEDKLAGLLENPDKCHAVGDRARRHVLETYDWDGVTLHTEAIYYTLLRGF